MSGTGYVLHGGHGGGAIDLVILMLPVLVLGGVLLFSRFNSRRAGPAGPDEAMPDRHGDEPI